METSHPPELPVPLHLRELPNDLRLYLPHSGGWTVHIKHDGQQEYCYFKNPGEDHFHLLLKGEIYLQFGESKFCLNCAYRYAHATNDRLYWQRGVRMNREPLV